MNAIANVEKVDLNAEHSNLAAVSEVEASIRDFVKDAAFLGRPNSVTSTSTSTRTEPGPEIVVSNVNALVQRVAGASIGEIQNLISELESLRELLHAEGQRVQREISGYAQLSQAAMKSTRMIADNVTQWRGAADGFRNS
ncbi:MAG: hypothetical protein NVS1B11_37750 [Terriglobales bacterium]